MIDEFNSFSSRDVFAGKINHFFKKPLANTLASGETNHCNHENYETHAKTVVIIRGVW